VPRRNSPSLGIWMRLCAPSHAPATSWRAFVSMRPIGGSSDPVGSPATMNPTLLCGSCALAPHLGSRCREPCEARARGDARKRLCRQGNARHEGSEPTGAGACGRNEEGEDIRPSSHRQKFEQGDCAEILTFRGRMWPAQPSGLPILLRRSNTTRLKPSSNGT
jgi:hypothetical protein